jgi:hypothetical protein
MARETKFQLHTRISDTYGAERRAPLEKLKFPMGLTSTTLAAGMLI